MNREGKKKSVMLPGSYAHLIVIRSCLLPDVATVI